MATKGETLTVLALRVPEAHAAAVRAYAEHLTKTTRIRVTASAAGAALLEAGLVTFGLIEAPERAPVAPATSKRAAPGAKKGAKRARKP